MIAVRKAQGSNIARKARLALVGFWLHTLICECLVLHTLICDCLAWHTAEGQTILDGLQLCYRPSMCYGASCAIDQACAID